MKVTELVAKQGNVDIVVQIVEISAPREFSKFGKTGRVASAQAKDDSGTIQLSLWNEQIDQVKVGDSVHIQNGYCSEWQGEKQLSTGRMGTMEVETPSAQELVEKADEEPNGEAAPAEVKEEEVKD